MRARIPAWTAFLALVLIAGCAGNEPPARVGTAAAAAFRVAVRDGVPQLTRDGVPVRARIFWGKAGDSGDTRIGPQERTVAFAFTAPESTPTAALHLRFGADSGTVAIRSLRIRDEAAGTDLVDERFAGGEAAFARDWGWWIDAGGRPLPVRAEFPGDGLRLVFTADDRLLDFRLFRRGFALVEGRRYAVEIAIRADRERPFRPAIHHHADDMHVIAGLPSPYARQQRLAAEAGVDIVSFYVPRAVWVRPGQEPDFHQIDRLCAAALAGDPGAYLIPRINLDPPAWWLEAHPEADMRFEDGRRLGKVAVASAAYRADAIAALRRTIRRCEERFAGRMAGYHPSGQNTNEWFYHEAWNRLLTGYDDATQAAWRDWQRAHGVAEPLAVPDPARRHGDAALGLRDPAVDADLTGFAAFQQEVMAGFLADLARAVKAEAGPDRLSLLFYGYLFEFAKATNGPATSGHYALRRLLACPEVDVLAGPISYIDRQSGGGAPCMSAAESVALAGKLWLNEDDSRTHLAAGSRFAGWQSGARSLDEARQQLRRNLGQAACRNLGLWWMDLPGTGWFDDAALWREMADAAVYERGLLAAPRPFRPQIAAVLDEASMQQVLASGVAPASTRALIGDGLARLGRIGAPYGQYLLDDLLAERAGARLEVMLAAWALDGAQRRALRARAAGRATIWCWAPGYIDRDAVAFSPAASAELTGFAVVERATGGSAQVRATADGLALGLPAAFGPDLPLRPLLAVQAMPGDHVLATWADGAPAVVWRDGAAGPSVLVATTEVPTALLRAAARAAGVHLYAQQDAQVWANGDLLSVHAVAAGPLVLDAGVPGTVRDAVDGAVVGAGPVFTLDLAAGETRVLRLGGR